MEPSNLEKNSYQPPSSEDILSAYNYFKDNVDKETDADPDGILAGLGLDIYYWDDNEKKELNIGDLNMFNDFMSANEDLIIQEEGSGLLAMVKDIYSSMKSEIATMPDGELKNALTYDFNNLTEMIKQKKFANQVLGLE